MEYHRQVIKHKTFGRGVITALTDSTVTVAFPEQEKKFVFPDAFKDFLVLQDKKMQQYIAAKIAENDAAVNRQRQEKQLELKRRHKLLNFTISANSHAVFNVEPKDLKQVCKTFKLSTGRYLSGYSKGRTKIAERLKTELCSPLYREGAAGKPEQERRIVGAFMVREDYIGEDCREGFVEGHPQHRILLPAGKPLLFWERFDQEAPLRWGNTAFKYCSAAVMNDILSEMVQIFTNTAQEESALSFYQYFCKINRLRPFIQIDSMDAASKIVV